MPDNLKYKYDPFADVLTVEGIKYHGDFFRALGSALNTGDIFRFMNREKDGSVTIQTIKKLNSPPGKLREEGAAMAERALARVLCGECTIAQVVTTELVEKLLDDWIRQERRPGGLLDPQTLKAASEPIGGLTNNTPYYTGRE
jgi:hypothetical protein